jgi:TM2 domain-containing membrane protein YozV
MSDNFNSPTPSDNLTAQQQKIAEAKEIAFQDRREALRLVIEVLRMNPNNVEAIWMYVNLVEEQDKKIKGLQKLLRLDPTHQKARALLNKLELPVTSIVPQEKPKIVHRANTSVHWPANEQNSDVAVQEQNQLLKRMVEQQNEMLRQRQSTPVINIHNAPTANATVMGTPYPVEVQNQTAFLIGVLVGIFLSTFGIAHIVNGKVGQGILWILVGWFIWLPIAALIVSLSAGLGACLVLPLHIVFAYNNAKNGARTVRLPYYVA